MREQDSSWGSRQQGGQAGAGTAAATPRLVSLVRPADTPSLLPLAPGALCPALCSQEQLHRLLAAAQRLPVELRIQLELHARSEPADCWHKQLTQRLQLEQERLLAQPTAQPAAHSMFGSVVSAPITRRPAAALPQGSLKVVASS